MVKTRFRHIVFGGLKPDWPQNLTGDLCVVRSESANRHFNIAKGVVGKGARGVDLDHQGFGSCALHGGKVGMEAGFCTTAREKLVQGTNSIACAKAFFQNSQ